MEGKHTTPADIERTSMAIIAEELSIRRITLSEEIAPVVRRVIHTTADFEYAENLRFTSQAVMKGVRVVKSGAVLVTDTNMALSGISKPTLQRLGGSCRCYMAEPEIDAEAKERATTRAAVSMERALEEYASPVLAVGNAPTALLKIVERMDCGARPALVIGVPVGFVNVVESKELLLTACEKYGVPAIVAMGRKGGSNVAAAICNALLYMAADRLDPARRGWM